MRRWESGQEIKEPVIGVKIPCERWKDVATRLRVFANHRRKPLYALISPIVDAVVDRESVVGLKGFVRLAGSISRPFFRRLLRSNPCPMPRERGR